jgi:16S rRNA (guanine527-N7)-methyltransferase
MRVSRETVVAGGFLHNRVPPALDDVVSPKLRQRLLAYIQLLLAWSSVTNLVSKKALEDVWERHIADSLQLVDLAPNATSWLDLGAGAGFPSVVIACQLAERAGAQVHAVESDGRKCVFLREVARKLHLPLLHVHNRRAESLSYTEMWPIDALTARAFASLSKTLRIAVPFLDHGATAVLPRGRTTSRELDDVNSVCYSCECVPNGSKRGVILIIQRRKLANPL